MPDPREILRAHVNDALVAGVIVKNCGDRKWTRSVGRSQRDRVALADPMAARETLRHEHARLRVETAHQFSPRTTEKLELTSFAADHRHGYFRIAHRHFDFAEAVDGFNGRMLRQKFDNVRRKKGTAA